MRTRLWLAMLFSVSTAALTAGCDEVRTDLGLDLSLERSAYSLGDTVWIQIQNPRPDTVRYHTNRCHEVYRRIGGEVEFDQWSVEGSGPSLSGCPWDTMHYPRSIPPAARDSSFIVLRPSRYEAGEYQIAIIGHSEADGMRAFSPWFDVVDP